MKKSNIFKYLIGAIGVVMLANFTTPTFAKFPTMQNTQVVLEDVVDDPADEPVVPEPTLTMPAVEDLGPVIVNDSTGIGDSNFYQLLVNVFNAKYATADNFVRQSQLRVNMLADVTEINFQNTRIISIAGLNKLNLPSLQKLNLGANTISEIKTEDLKYLPALTELYLHENNISQLTLPSSLNKLQVLNLNANKLSTIDISNVYSGVVSLSFNKFTNINDIKFPRKLAGTDLIVELFNNNIVNADEMYLKNGVLENGGQITIELGVQGIGLNYKATDDEDEKVVPVVSRNSAIKCYNINDSYNIEMVIKNIITNQEVETISNTEEKISSLILPIGEYSLTYINKETKQPIYNYYNSVNCAYKEITSFKVIPKSPIVKFVIDGKEYDEYAKFTSWNAKIVATNTETEGELYYSINGGKWIKGSEVKLTRGWQFVVSFKVVYNDNLASHLTSKRVYMSQNPYIPDLLMVLIIAAVVVLFFVVILPLLVKYTIKR